MRLLSRAEELVLLAVRRLKTDAYCVPIRQHLMNVTAKDWSFGAIYDPLERLEKKGLLESYLTEPLQYRGGRSKRIYTLTKDGLKALIEIKTIEEAIWDGITKPVLESEL